MATTNNTTAAVVNFATLVNNPAAMVPVANCAALVAANTLAAITAQTPFAPLPVNAKNQSTQAANNWPLAVAGFNVLLNALQAQGVNAMAIYRQAKAGTIWLNGWLTKVEVMVSTSKAGGYNVKVKQLQKAGGQLEWHVQKYASLEAIAQCPVVLGALVNSIAVQQQAAIAPAKPAKA